MKKSRFTDNQIIAILWNEKPVSIRCDNGPEYAGNTHDNMG